VAGLLAAACRPGAPTVLPEQRRRVLLVTVDTLRADHLGINAHPQEITPFLDALLAGGHNFTHAITPIPRTTPALASLLTGAYPHTTGVRTLVDPLGAGVLTLTERLRERGYQTIAVVSNHMLTAERGLDRGFDVYDFADDTRDATGTTDAALARAAEHAPEANILLWVHYIDPHVPYYPPPELAERFDPGYQGRYRTHFGTEPGAMGTRAYPEDLPKERAVYRNDLPDRVNAHIRRLHTADVRYTDDQIERLVTGLRERLGEDWLVVFSSDHGESLGEHDYFFDHGDYVYNASLRVPLAFVFAPGDPLHGSRSIDAWVSLIDVAPTLAELLILPDTADWGLQVEGRSLVPYLRGENPGARVLFAESGHSYYPHLLHRRVRFDVNGRFRAVVDGDRKLIWTPGARPGRGFELYDLASDPDETVDLSRQEPQRVAELRKRLDGWVRTGASTPRRIGPEDRERLRALGYVDD
jgi:arylsulfatase A-like enzyme